MTYRAFRPTRRMGFSAEHSPELSVAGQKDRQSDDRADTIDDTELVRS